jgi:hypothetical protein
MGGEFRSKGVNIALGPGTIYPTTCYKGLLIMLVVGPLGRVSEGGRNWEGKLPHRSFSVRIRYYFIL